MEEVREKRRFADALEHVADRVGREARREAEKTEQKNLDDVAQRISQSQLGIQVATSRLSSSTGNKTP